VIVRQTLENHTRGSTPVIATSAGTIKICKLADPERFDKGDPSQPAKYETWLSQMRDKLQNNAPQFPTAGMRVAYVRARLTGEALGRVLVRSEQRPFSDTEEVFEFLSKFYRNVNRAIIAESKLTKLYMKNADKFQDFLSEFSQLVTESDLPERYWKRELWKRITKRLKEKFMDDMDDPNITYDRLVDKAINASNRYEAIDLESQAIS